jgi:large subunit ribosomal protein L18
MRQAKKINQIRERRKRRVRSALKGTASKPRLSVFRSNCHTYVQLIDDDAMKTLVSASTKNLPKEKKPLPKSEQARALGELVAEKAIKENIKQAVFDRGSYLFHGRVEAVLEAARKKGLKI